MVIIEHTHYKTMYTVKYLKLNNKINALTNPQEEREKQQVSRLSRVCCDTLFI